MMACHCDCYCDCLMMACHCDRKLCTGEEGTGKVYKKPLHYKGSKFHRIIPQVRAMAMTVTIIVFFLLLAWY